ncbi:GNAT family N-acetyltransferase [Nocardia miyunensis]|uniref:GNAT family N-acetyltransferase n=1 Tax=Nocardia miyunensis TaxID=282684 RepID=UPI000A01EF50|nr:GNAT family N-acetyltransferase [Nocardia miyunensis]
MDDARPAVLTPDVAPPERIDLGDLVIRRWERDDTEAQFRAIEASYAELHTWMPWLPSRRTREQQAEFIEAAVASWPADGNCNYGIFDSAGTLLGTVGLHDRVGPATLEIGYWCHTGYTGRGVITRSVAALAEIVLVLPGVERVEIHCDAANVRSAAVPRRLGWRLERTEPRERHAPGESGQGMVWARERGDLPVGSGDQSRRAAQDRTGGATGL